MERKYIPVVTKAKKKPGFKPFQGDVTTFSTLFDEGEEAKERFLTVLNSNTACHAGLSSPRVGGPYDKYKGGYQLNAKGTPIAILNSICNIAVDEKIALRFLEWLQNYSPYAEVFHTKSARVTLKQGVMVANTDVPSNLLAGGLIAGRAMWEYPDIAKTWHAFVEGGLNPDLSFYLSHIFTISGADNFVVSPKSGHCALTGSAYPLESEINKWIVNFLTRNRRDTAIYRKSLNYSGIHATWQKDIKENVGVNHNTILNGMGEKKEKVNPFAKEAIKTVKVGPAIEYLVPVYKEKFKKWM